MTQWYYEKNTELLEHPLNLPFEKILEMNDAQFRQWCIDLRKLIVDLWDNKNLPPRVGYNLPDIIDNFRKVASYPVQEMETYNLITKENDIIRNTSTAGNASCQFFPGMMKTKITYSSKKDGKSIYDYFAEDNLLDTFVTYASRHFRRDSFYHYSTPISVGDVLKLGANVHHVSGFEPFLDWYTSSNVPSFDHDFWMCPVKEAKEYTGYNQELKKKRNIVVHIDEIERLADKIPSRCISNLDRNRSEYYSVRFYKYGQKLFPIGLKAFRVSFCQYAVQFPPLVARYVYEKFTAHIKDQDRINIYDPSAGWGGRLLGAMAVDSRRNIHYIGTDPNTDHNTTEGRTKYHEMADMFNREVRSKGKLFPKKHSYEIYQLGSEVIGNDPEFQKYKGKLDLVFTSPPYFSKEVYSDDEEQSCHKFDSYDSWRDGFLRPTLETAVSFLRRDRYLLWNIADIALDNKLLPLEQDSIDILQSLGMEYKGTLKMALAAMPGSNRFEETGEFEITKKHTLFGTKEIKTPVLQGKMKNFAQIENNGKKIMVKFEPIFLFYKK